MLDPFCGGGSIPLEAQRLGLEVHASDLNPVAVLITKAMIEIPPRFAGQPPVNPDAQNALAQGQTWRGTTGLAEDVRCYGKWMRDEAEKRIGHLYPKVTLPDEHGGGEATVIAWIWARTVRCPNPACGAHMPLVKSFWLSRKKRKKAWVQPIVDKVGKTVKFEVLTGNPDSNLNRKIVSGTGFVNESGKKVKSTFRCVICDVGVAKGDYIDDEANGRRMDFMPLALVVEAHRKRTYLPFDDVHMTVLMDVEEYVSNSVPSFEGPNQPARGTFASNAQGRIYGFKTFADYHTSRQLCALTTFTELVNEARKQVETDASKLGRGEAKVYADVVATYLALSVSRSASMWSSLCWWQSSGEFVVQVFARQAIAMVWDFAEVNPLSNATGNWSGAVDWITRVIEMLPTTLAGHTKQHDAAVATESDKNVPWLVSTDPPYYDNVGYADLSDFYYVWLRRSLSKTYTSLFQTLLTPKTQELVATPYRFDGDKTKANEHFLTGLRQVFHLMRIHAHPNYPMTVYYAYKQTKTDGEDGSTVSTGWETMLQGLLDAGFQITGTLPMRTEREIRPVARETNALASSIVLVCRPRPDDAKETTRRDFHAIVHRELREALLLLQNDNIAPVDLAQAVIGPGMAVFSRYSNVLEANGKPMRIRAALQTINDILDAYFAEQEGELDADTSFCTAWFEQHSMEVGAFGEADGLARAKNSSVQGVAESGVLRARAGRVRLLNRDEYQDEWDPTSDSRRNTWKCTQYLIRALERGGETEAGRLVNLLGGGASEAARALAYRLYAICDRKGWSQEAVTYNTLVTSWTHIQAAAAESGTEERPGDLF